MPAGRTVVSYEDVAHSVGDLTFERRSARGYLSALSRAGRIAADGEPWWPLLVEDDQYWMPEQVAEWVLEAFF